MGVRKKKSSILKGHVTEELAAVSKSLYAAPIQIWIQMVADILCVTVLLKDCSRVLSHEGYDMQDAITVVLWH